MENVKHNGVKLGLFDTQWMNCVNDPQVLAWDASKEDAVSRAVELAEKYCIENAKKAIAAAEQAQQAEPVAWVRFCGDGCYEGPLMNSSPAMDGARRTSGAWTPLFAAQPVARDVLMEALVSLREAIIDVYHESVGHSSVIEKKMRKIDIAAIADRHAAQPPAVAGAVTDGYALVPIDPTEEQWGGLARDIMMAFDLGGKSPASLLANMRFSWEDLPEWMRKELHDPESTAVLSKGTRAVLIYRAMLAAAIDGGIYSPSHNAYANKAMHDREVSFERIKCRIRDVFTTYGHTRKLTLEQLVQVADILGIEHDVEA